MIQSRRTGEHHDAGLGGAAHVVLRRRDVRHIAVAPRLDTAAQRRDQNPLRNGDRSGSSATAAPPSRPQTCSMVARVGVSAMPLEAIRCNTTSSSSRSSGTCWMTSAPASTSSATPIADVEWAETVNPCRCAAWASATIAGRSSRGEPHGFGLSPS